MYKRQIISMLLYFRYNFANTVTIIQDGKMHPNVATTAPSTPAILSPTKVAELTAIGPGVICDIVIRSVNSDIDVYKRQAEDHPQDHC